MYISRPELQARLLEMAQKCQAAQQPLVLLGDAGVGKATLMAWFAGQPEFASRFGDRRIWVDGKVGASLRQWLELLQIYLFPINERMNVDDPTILLAHLKAKTASGSWLFLLENCDCVEFLDTVPALLNTDSLAVASTPSESPARLELPQSCCLEVPRFQTLETLNLFREAFSPIPSEQEMKLLNEFEQILEGNPFALQVIFALWHTSQKPELLLRELKSAKSAHPAQKAIQTWSVLAGEQQKSRLGQIGWLPELRVYGLIAFQAVWDETNERAREDIKRLEYSRLLEPISAGTWKIPEAVLQYARAQQDERNRHKELDAWLRRLSRLPVLRQSKADFEAAVPSMSFFEALRTERRLDLRYSRSTLVHLLRRLFFIRHLTPEWELLLQHSQLFTAQDLALGYSLNAQSQFDAGRLWLWAGLVFVIFFCLALGSWQLAIAGTVGALGFGYYLLGNALHRDATWLAIWQDALKRK
jgi:hypothetical protein